MTRTELAPISAAGSATAPLVRQIELRGVRVHNLKQIDLDIPLGKLVVLSGVSGSGKSSLAFDTIFAEGQRRYIESFSATARQYLERIERPNADRIAHVPPTIAIRTESSLRHLSARTTTASLVEIDAGLKRLFSRLGRVVCPDCQTEVRASSPEDLAQAANQLPAGTRFQFCFVPSETDGPNDPGTWRLRGFTRAIIANRSVSLDGLCPKKGSDPLPHEANSNADRNGKGSDPFLGQSPLDIWLIVDRLVAGKATADRVTESAETAFREGSGRCAMLIAASTVQATNSPMPDDRQPELLTIDDQPWRVIRFSRHWECATCGREFLPPDPRLFQPDTNDPCPGCHRLESHSEASECSVCRGTRLGPRALAVRVADRNLADLLSMTASAAESVLQEIASGLSDASRSVARLVFDDILERLSIVRDMGLGHLTLQRSARSLSEGQVRRLMLAAAIGSRITGTLCLVDEPSAGLHAGEIPLVIRMLRRLQQQRNSVIVVDHAPEIVNAADYVIDLGPGAGPQGGTVVFAGLPGKLANIPNSATARALDSSPQAAVSVRPRRQATDWITLSRVHHRNLQDLTVRLPLGVLCVVTGPGGIGKTSLVIETLVPALQTRFGLMTKTPLARCDAVTGGEGLAEVSVVDRAPLTRSSRSNAATWIDVFDEIRDVFALTADARQRGFTAQHFSFNAPQGGRCRACRGTGVLRHDMQFLPDVSLPCPECAGTRYRRDVLEIKYRGRSIADVLSMSAAEAAAFFRNHPRLQARLQMLKQIGLDYLVLGQPTETLSGGEAQRLKLASRLTPGRGSTLIVCDEATNGLHPADVSRLVACFDELLAVGHSIIVIDNNPSLLQAADHIIELGPGAGDQGGQVVRITPAD